MLILNNNKGNTAMESMFRFVKNVISATVIVITDVIVSIFVII